MSLPSLPHPENITTANFERYTDYPSPDNRSPDESPKVPDPLPGFHTYLGGGILLADSQLAATVTTAANNEVFVAHPTLSQVWCRDERIGRGGAGLVFREYLLHSGADNPPARAVKKQVTRLGDAAASTTPDEIKNELSLLLFFSQSSRPDLFTRCDGWFMEGPHLMIVMELLSFDLEEHMERTGGPIAEFDARTIVRQVLEALSFMHENDVSHRDVKLNNIMIATRPTPASPSTPWSVRLGDFGLSQYHADPTLVPDDHINTSGTPAYKAPELFHQLEPEEDTLLLFEAKADIWALGITVYRMLTMEPPFDFSPGEDDPAAVRNYCILGPPKGPMDRARVSEQGRGFIRKLTHKNAKQRPTAAGALEQERWVNGIV